MMTKFFYIARDYQQGNLIKGSLVANNKLEVIDYLRREQYLIIAIHNNDIYSIKEYIKSIGKDEKITRCKATVPTALYRRQTVPYL